MCRVFFFERIGVRIYIYENSFLSDFILSFFIFAKIKSKTGKKRDTRRAMKMRVRLGCVQVLLHQRPFVPVETPFF